MNASLVRVEVEDRGTGIPEEFRSRIFEKFAQADASSSRRFEGTGLGLAITRQLVELMHGEVGFTTAVGQGTTFYFQLPRAPSNEQMSRITDTGIRHVSIPDPLAIEVLESPPRQRVLYVEDDMDLSNVISTSLSAHATVVEARTVAAAEALLREGRFSLVVLDLTLPDGNGLELLNAISKHSPEPIPVVILSATETPRDVQQRVAAALVKSRISEAHTVEVILSLLKTQPSAAGVESQAMYTQRELQG